MVVRGEDALSRGLRVLGGVRGQRAPTVPRWHRGERLRAEVDPEDECYLLYTSGTTARPKGVVQVHDAIARNGWRIGEYQCLDENDVVWFYYPFFFSAGLHQRHARHAIPRCLADPATLLRPGDRRSSLIEREKATTWHLWPHTLKELTQHPDWSTAGTTPCFTRERAPTTPCREDRPKTASAASTCTA